MTPSLTITLVTILLTTGCAPTSPTPTTVGPTVASASEFLPGFRVKAGSVLQYNQETRVTVNAPGVSVPPALVRNMITLEVLSVDHQGTSRVRIDLNGKPRALLRFRGTGQLLELQPLTSEQIKDIEEAASLLGGLVWDRPVRVGDSFPLKQGLPRLQGFDQAANIVGTLMLTGFSRSGTCRVADFRASLRLDSQRPLEFMDQKSGRRFHMEMTGSGRSRHEVETAATLDIHMVLNVDLTEVQGSGRGQITIRTDMKLNDSSLRFLGCG